MEPGLGPVFFGFGGCYCGCVFRFLKPGLPAAATALGTGGSFFNLYTTILGRIFLLPISCMFLIHISIVVRYSASKSLVCAQPQEERHFSLCTAFKQMPSVPNCHKNCPQVLLSPSSQSICRFVFAKIFIYNKLKSVMYPISHHCYEVLP